jgi:hypothetical protein
MPITDHNRLIKNAAKSLLQPIGCVQKGASRTWLDRQPLWVGVVEFQPSSWSRGSYLNVGACWLWYEKDYLSFDDGYRIEGFHALDNEQQFAEVTLELATRARDEVLAIRSKFSSLDLIATHLKTKDFSSIWNNYHAAVAAALTNDMVHAAERFSAVAATAEDAPWVVELKRGAAILEKIATDPLQFRDAISQIVERSKVRLKLGIEKGIASSQAHPTN